MKSTRIAALVSSLALGAVGLTPGLATAATSSTGTANTQSVCREINAPVALGPGQPATERISGTLCIPTRFAGRERQLDILVHGASYNRTYWDFPVQQSQYSYVNRTLAAGRATFAYDRLGTGKSSRPASGLITVGADANVLHQIVQFVRHTHLVQKVNVVGHSFGTIVATHEIATYHDIDRLIVTGELHAVGSNQDTVIHSFYPAAQDPRFAGHGYDAGYLTTLPGIRGDIFYYPLTTEPTVVSYDEAHKDVVSATQFADGVGEANAPAGANLTNQVDVPVLVIAGQYDTIFCGLALDCNNTTAVKANEALYYTSSPSLTAKIVASTGHDLALHTTAASSFATIDQWLRSH